jgi:hypothetical protein
MVTGHRIRSPAINIAPDREFLLACSNYGLTDANPSGTWSIAAFTSYTVTAG